MLEIPEIALIDLAKARTLIRAAGGAIVVAHAVPMILTAGAALASLLDVLRAADSPHGEEIAVFVAGFLAFGMQVALGAGLLAIGQRAPSGGWRLVALVGVAVGLLLSPVGLSLGLATCGAGSLLHAAACVLLIAAGAQLLRRRVSVGLRRLDEEDAA